jgi:hypothetical protein
MDELGDGTRELSGVSAVEGLGEPVDVVPVHLRERPLALRGRHVVADPTIGVAGQPGHEAV